MYHLHSPAIFDIFFTVLPFVSLTVNNETSSDTFVIENGTTIKSICYAEGSRPAVDLSWLINGERVDPRLVVLNETSKNDDNRTFNSITTVQFRPKFVQGTINCVVHSLSRYFSHNVSIYIMGMFLLIINNIKKVYTSNYYTHQMANCVQNLIIPKFNDTVTSQVV